MPGAGFDRRPGLASPAPIGVRGVSCFLPFPISRMRNGVRSTAARISEITIPHMSEKWNVVSISVYPRSEGATYVPHPGRPDQLMRNVGATSVGGRFHLVVCTTTVFPALPTALRRQ